MEVKQSEHMKRGGKRNTGPNEYTRMTIDKAKMQQRKQLDIGNECIDTQ